MMESDDTGEIIVQDPDEVNREIVAGLLRMKGYHVEGSSSMANTMEQVRKRLHSLLILRCMLEENGEERMIALLHQANPDMEILLLVPPWGIPAGRKMVRSNAFDYLIYPPHVYPSQMDELVLHVHKAVEKSRLRVQARDKQADFDRKIVHEREKFLTRQFASSRVLVEMFEKKLPIFAGHSCRVTRYAGWIADDMCMPKPMANDLEVASSLHDIGYLGLPDAYLSKIGPLNSAERDGVRSHPLMGYEVMDDMLPRRALEFLKHHHERWDGLGYPDGLSGHNIPLGARIIALADAFDAMMSERTYRQSLKMDSALLEVGQNKNRQFDPALADVFVEGVSKRIDRVSGGSGTRLS
jgi:putative two-component system response regulator